MEFAHYDDLERFMAFWKDNPQGLSQFVGRAVGRIAPKNYDEMFRSIGASYFACLDICGRIDHLFKNYNKPLGGEKGRLFQEMLKIKLDSEVLIIHDKSGNHKGVRVMILRSEIEDLPHFSVRYFAKLQLEWTGFLRKVWVWNEKGFPSFEKVSADEDDCTFWNFRAPINTLHGVVIYPEAHGFLDIAETKSVANLIKLASNLTGFQN